MSHPGTIAAASADSPVTGLTPPVSLERAPPAPSPSSSYLASPASISTPCTVPSMSRASEILNSSDALSSLMDTLKPQLQAAVSLLVQNNSVNQQASPSARSEAFIQEPRAAVETLETNERDILTQNINKNVHMAARRRDQEQCSSDVSKPQKENISHSDNISKHAELLAKKLEIIKKIHMPIQDIKETLATQNVMLSQFLENNKNVGEFLKDFFSAILSVLEIKNEDSAINYAKEGANSADKNGKKAVKRTNNNEGIRETPKRRRLKDKNVSVVSRSAKDFTKDKSSQTKSRNESHQYKQIQNQKPQDMRDHPKKRSDKQNALAENHSHKDVPRENFFLKQQSNTTKNRCNYSKTVHYGGRKEYHRHKKTHDSSEKEEYQIVKDPTRPQIAQKIILRKKSICGIQEKANLKKHAKHEGQNGNGYDNDFEPEKKLNTGSYSYYRSKLDELKIMNTLRKGGLPPEYNEHDTKWTLKHKAYSHGLVELIDHSEIYVDDTYLKKSLRESNDCRSLARKLVTEIFTERALIACAVPGLKNINKKPVLDKWALMVLFDYVEDMAKIKNWPPYVHTDVIKSLKHVMYHIKHKIRK